MIFYFNQNKEKVIFLFSPPATVPLPTPRHYFLNHYTARSQEHRKSPKQQICFFFFIWLWGFWFFRLLFYWRAAVARPKMVEAVAETKRRWRRASWWHALSYKTMASFRRRSRFGSDSNRAVLVSKRRWRKWQTESFPNFRLQWMVDERRGDTMVGGSVRLVSVRFEMLHFWNQIWGTFEYWWWTLGRVQLAGVWKVWGGFNVSLKGWRHLRWFQFGYGRLKTFEVVSMFLWKDWRLKTFQGWRENKMYFVILKIQNTWENTNKFLLVKKWMLSE